MIKQQLSKMEVTQNSSIETICKAICNKGEYNYYRIIKTPSHIEVKLSPKNNNQEEINFVVDNTKYSKIDLKFNLLKVNS